VPSTGWTRRVELWPYERLFKEADLVVIARAKSSVPCKDKWEEDLFGAELFQGVETSFKIASLLKGTPPSSVKMLHFKLKRSTLLNDGPSLVSFRTEPVRLKLEKGEEKELRQPHNTHYLAAKPEYLLFLKLRKDGRYEAVSGQIDPQGSVRTLIQNMGL
jgi:hypothetical protein